jgi:hypothetical protein
MPATLDAKEFQAELRRFDTLSQESARIADPAAQAHGRALVQAVLGLHGAGLERIFAHLEAAGETGRTVLDACVRDEVVGGSVAAAWVARFGTEGARFVIVAQKLGAQIAQMRFLEHHEPGQALALRRLHPKLGPNVEVGRGWRDARRRHTRLERGTIYHAISPSRATLFPPSSCR